MIGVRVAIVVLLCGVAAAEPKRDKSETAAALFERGRELTKQGDHKRACALFEESDRMVAALGTELNLAICWAKVGKLTAARDLLRTVIERATAADQPARVQVATQELDALVARIPRVQIQIVGGTALVILDGKQVDVSGAIEIDPGPHKVVAVAEDGRRHELIFEATGGPQRVAVDLARVEQPQIFEDKRRPGWATTSKVLAAATIADLGLLVYSQFAALLSHDRGAKDGSLSAFDDAERHLERAYVFGLGGIALIGATVGVYLAAPSEHAGPAKPGTTFVTTARRRSWLAIVGALGAGTAIAAGLGVYYETHAIRGEKNLLADCRDGCNTDQFQTVHLDIANAATAGLTGMALIGIATVIYFKAPRTRITIAPTAVGISGRF